LTAASCALAYESSSYSNSAFTPEEEVLVKEVGKEAPVPLIDADKSEEEDDVRGLEGAGEGFI
jgi:hypothetical protein